MGGRNARARENHPTRERRNVAGRETRFYLSPPRLALGDFRVFFLLVVHKLRDTAARKLIEEKRVNEGEEAR